VGYKVARNPELGADAPKIQREEQKKIDEASPLSDDEQTERNTLLIKVYNWNVSHFNEKVLLHSFIYCFLFILGIYKLDKKRF
jgi:hypothetical protein